MNRVKEELQDKAEMPLVDLDLGTIHPALMNLVISGQATPYVHNSWAFVNGVSTYLCTYKVFLMLMKNQPIV